MKIKIASTIVFVVFFQYMGKASGEELDCGTFTYNPDTDYCLTSVGGSCRLVFCRIGYCRKDGQCAPEIGGNCDKSCPEGKILARNIGCVCIGAKLNFNCEVAVPPAPCASCTDQQICFEGNRRCFGDIDICDIVKCQNGGTCSGTNIKDYECSCAPGFNGKLCEIADDC